MKDQINPLLQKLGEKRHRLNELQFQLGVLQEEINDLENNQIVPLLVEHGQNMAGFEHEGTQFKVSIKPVIRGSVSYENGREAAEIWQRIKGETPAWDISIKGGPEDLDTLSQEGYTVKGKPAIAWNSLAAMIKAGIKEGTLSEKDKEVLKVSIVNTLEVKES